VEIPEARQFHASAAWSIFATIEPFDTALARRYGPPRSLEDYVAKAQLDNYDNVRAQFEAFNAHLDAAKPSTGVIYWMLNNAWPSLHWHLYDYFLNPAGAYFGAKTANEPVHIQYAYDTRAIMLVNHTLAREQGLRALIRIRNLDGSIAYERSLKDIDLEENSARQLAMLPALTGLSRTYFIELELASSRGKSISRNVYWLSAHPMNPTGNIRPGTSRPWRDTRISRPCSLCRPRPLRFRQRCGTREARTSPRSP